MTSLKDFLGFVINPPPGDPTSTASRDSLPGWVGVVHEAPLNPKWPEFGAAFDGSTDDAIAINKALAALTNGGEMIWPGDAIVGAPLIPAANGVKISGLGVGKSRARQKAGTTIQGIFQATNITDLTISDIEIDQSLVTGGSTTQQMAVFLISSNATGIQRATLERLYMHGGPQRGIYLLNNGTGPLEATMRDTRTEGFAGIGIFGGGTAGITYGRIYGGRVKGCAGPGFQVSNASDIEFHGFDATDQTGAGANGHGAVFSISKNIRIFGGEYSRNGSAGGAGLVFSAQCVSFQVDGARCDSNSGIGLDIDLNNGVDNTIYNAYAAIHGAICTANGSHGVFVNFANGLTFSGLQATGNTGTGCALVATNCAIVGAHLNNNTGNGWFSADKAGSPGVPPMGGHKFYSLFAIGNTAGVSSDTATTASVTV